MNPYIVVEELETRIAEWSGATYGIAVESCTMAILLSLKYLKVEGTIIQLPKFTYPGVACSIIHAGAKIEFTDDKWEGIYQLYPVKIIDGALRFRKGMYVKDTLHCLSFHLRKRLNLGRGGMILTDSKDAYDWLRLARFDGREPIPLQEQKEFKVLGYNAYMQPADAARAIQIFEVLRNQDLPDLPFEEQKYTDLSAHKIFYQ